MRIAVLSANLGGYDPVVESVPQVVEGSTVAFYRFTDANFPPRVKAMTPALQCAVPKMFGWELVPDYDLYLWVDASCALLSSDCVARWLAQLGTAEMVLLKHPDRSTVREEYEFLKTRMARPGETYLTSRYAHEWIDAQYAAVHHPWFTDNALYASTAFLYRPTFRVQSMMKDWWFHKSRYFLHDQLALPYVIREHQVHVRVIAEKYTDCAYLTYVRNRKAVA